MDCPAKSLGITWAKLAEKRGKSGQTVARPSVERTRNHWVSFGGFRFALSVSSVWVRLPVEARKISQQIHRFFDGLQPARTATNRRLEQIWDNAIVTAKLAESPGKRLPLSALELAALLGVPIKTLAKWREVRAGGASGEAGPDYVRVGRHIRYPDAAIREWLKSRLAPSSTLPEELIYVARSTAESPAIDPPRLAGLLADLDSLVKIKQLASK